VGPKSETFDLQSDATQFHTIPYLTIPAAERMWVSRHSRRVVPCQPAVVPTAVSLCHYTYSALLSLCHYVTERLLRASSHPLACSQRQRQRERRGLQGEGQGEGGGERQGGRCPEPGRVGCCGGASCMA